MLVYMLYHIANREKKILELIRFRMKESGKDYDVRIMDFDEGTIEALIQKPDVIITHPVRDDHGACRITALKALYNPVVITLETEGLMDFDDELTVRLRIGENLYDKALVDYYFFWGPRPCRIFADRLVKENKVTDAGRVKWCGYVMYELSLVKKQETYITRSRLYDEKKKNYDRALLFLTGFNTVDADCEEQIQQELASYVEMSDFSLDENGNPDQDQMQHARENIVKSAKFRDAYLQLIRDYAKECRSTLIWVKLHPTECGGGNELRYREILCDLENVEIISEDVPVGILIENADVLVHYGSTAGLEAVLYKKPTLAISGDYDSNVELFESTYKVNIKNKEEIIKILSSEFQYSEKETTVKFIYENFGIDVNKPNHPIDTLISLVDIKNKGQKIEKTNNRNMYKNKYMILFFKSALKEALIRLKERRVREAYKLAIATIRMWI